MTIWIVTDSSCDQPQDILQKHKITVIPLFIIVGEQGSWDGAELSHQEFSGRLPGFKPAPKTAAPGPVVFRKIFEQLAATMRAG